MPFCAVSCPYCHFSKTGLSRVAVERYLGALEREIALRAPLASGQAFSSVFFGGGTPSALGSWAFDRMWGALKGAFTIAPGAEITLEVNPESMGPRLLDTWAKAGVNRLSFGVQSFVPSELATLGRMHDEHRAAEAFALARAHGFRRLSLDLMFGYPGHTAVHWTRTLDAALALAPEHISAYGFIPETGTPTGDAIERGEAHMVPPEVEASFHAEADARFTAAGLALYETSNWSLPDAESRHNLTYWLRRDHLALGPSAHGLWKGVRRANAYALGEWAGSLERGEDPATLERDTPASRADETVMLALRLGSGLVLADLPQAHRNELLVRYGAAFEAAEAQGRLVRTSGGWCIPREHCFVADDTLAWLAIRARPIDPQECAA
ncbi:MAG: coproporphyrinogen III oxidase family protein [Candidatus Eisenbacteria bacterium]|nr:coproporphyrinogen III oxidase family protein [Candidatus Eisenbacteria bacterium]